MSLVGGALSVVAAAAFALRARAQWGVSLLVSYAIGALLGASFLEVLPHAITASGDASTTTATVLGGIWPSSCWKNWCCGAIATSSPARDTSRWRMTTGGTTSTITAAAA